MIDGVPGRLRGRGQFLALCVLDDAVDQAAEGAVKPTVGLRLALCYLVMAGVDRALVNGFWHKVRDPLAYEYSDTTRGHVRSTDARTILSQIARAVGTPLNADLMIRLRAARQSRTPPS